VRFAFIAAEKAEGRFPVALMCKLLGVQRSGLYAWLKREPSKRACRDAVDALFVREAHRRGKGRGGYRTVYNELRRQEHPVGKHRTARLMREQQLRGRPKKTYVVTTQSRHDLGYAPNLLGRKFTAQEPDTVWLADITYVLTSKGWVYLATVLDLFSRKIVGWAIRDNLGKDLATAALKDAIDRRRPAPGLVHHSDRGMHYASRDYRALLGKNGFVQSMSRKGNCWDNAPMESFFSTLKRELMAEMKFKAIDDARAALFEYIEIFYNSQRLHSALGYVPPAEYEQLRRKKRVA
jgi:putative transposase